MGLFKQIKQMKDVVKEAPDLVENAQAMAESQQAQAMQAQVAAASQAATPAGAVPAAATDDSAIAGVSLELYADVSRELTARGGDQTLGPTIAAERGVDRASWDAAVAGWNDRMRADPAIAKRFNSLWRGVG